LLALARPQAIDLRGIPFAALVEQLATAGRATSLAHKGEWLIMATWLVWLRARLLLPPDTPAQAEAVADAGQRRDRLLALREAQELDAWLAGRPQLGHDVFATRRHKQPACVPPRCIPGLRHKIHAQRQRLDTLRLRAGGRTTIGSATVRTAIHLASHTD
jgi:chromatin segregation and condensation protein Rec8/ScpA/Scc1 (kleisin family)